MNVLEYFDLNSPALISKFIQDEENKMLAKDEEHFSLKFNPIFNERASLILWVKLTFNTYNKKFSVLK